MSIDASALWAKLRQLNPTKYGLDNEANDLNHDKDLQQRAKSTVLRLINWKSKIADREPAPTEVEEHKTKPGGENANGRRLTS
jgi:hypothetical protein